MPPRVFLLRHGQGHHQLEPTDKNQYLHDPALTEEAKYSFAERLGQIAPIVLLPYAQEATDLPSDTGNDRAVIEEWFGELVDTSLVEEGWNSNTGIYAPTAKALKERAAKLRAWLQARPERAVAVVGHGNFWHHLTGEVDENGKQTTPYWSNNEWRSYHFVLEDGSANLEEDEESIARREVPN
ncbi:hypothetical protein MBLNU13_g09893t2 [Cladosporium sp. NU13]